MAHVPSSSPLPINRRPAQAQLGLDAAQDVRGPLLGEAPKHRLAMRPLNADDCGEYDRPNRTDGQPFNILARRDGRSRFAVRPPFARDYESAWSASREAASADRDWSRYRRSRVVSPLGSRFLLLSPGVAMAGVYHSLSARPSFQTSN
jgi:hypothetical protein